MGMIVGCSDKTDTNAVSEEDVTEKKIKIMTVESSQMGNEKIVKADILPSKRVDVLAEVNGAVNQLPVKVGSIVNVNQLLVGLENKDLQIQYQMQQNKSDQLKIQIEKSKSDRINAIESTERTIKKLEVQNESILRNLNSMKALYESGAVAKEDLNKLEDQYESAQLEMEDAKKNLEHLKKDFDDQLLEKQAAEAELAAANAKLQYDKTNIKAPFSGIVVDVLISKGEEVNPGQRVIRMEQHSPLYIEALLTESDLIEVRDKKELPVYLSLLQKKVTAKIDYISPSLDENQQGYPIRLILENQDKTLKPGMSSQVVLSTDQVKQVLAVPISAVLTEDNESYVYVVSEDIAEKRNVLIGRKTDEHIEIIEGLSEGESIAIVGQGQLEDGDSVKVLQ